MSEIVTRFAPSPTGQLHVGGARTAIFNWLLARQSGGRFILRIEDTDRQRSTEENTRGILASMAWLGLDWDDEPIYQSKRFDLYNAYIDKLLETGHAYYCTCTPEEVEAMREEARAKGAKPKYSGRCRERNPGPVPGAVVRLKAPISGATVVDDMVKGPVSVENAEMDDMIMRRADGTPTYNLAVVVDDSEMGVTHIIRGDDHLNNTPRQIIIYKALGLPLPRFGHVPMILGPDKKKLSKRHGATSVMEYETEGYLPEAMVNYLARLGWSSGDQEIFTRDELLSAFNTDNLGSSAAVFDVKKLQWLNSHYIKESDPARLAALTGPLLKAMGLSDPDPGYLASVVPLLQPRATTLAELAEKAVCFLIPDAELAFDPAAAEKFLTPESRERLGALRQVLAGLPAFTHDALEAAIQGYLERAEIKFKVLAQPLRVAITGVTASPGLYETMEVMGKQRVLARLDRALSL